MMLDFVPVRSFFAPPARSYWRWQDGGLVAVWKDDLTISFREELRAVVERLAPRGLPPLGSILLMLAACRENWEEPPDRRTLLHAHLGLLYGGGYSDLLTDVLAGLDQVHRVRQRVQGSGEKAALAAALFEDASGRHSPDKSAALAERFRLGLAKEEWEWKPESALDDLLHDLGCLRWGLKRLDFDKLDLRLKTGLDDVPAAAPLEPPPTSARDLIATLQDDAELGAVARLAQLLLAAVHLPRALSDPDELPIGGVSDIANRGSLDRLLLSELASDDLTLAVRVAMNEALYLRRESPPRTPPRQRKLLLDAGLRTWGVPRVFVAAVGLAVAAKTDPHIAVRAFRPALGEVVPVDLDSAAGLTAHLAALDHALHPAAAIAKLSQSDANDDDEAESDLILVTTDDTLADAEFQRQLREMEVGGLYFGAVSRDGRFELTQRGLRGSKLICRAKFDLDEVLKPRPQRPKLLAHGSDGDLPAFFQSPLPPLRFSCQVDLARSWFVHPSYVVSHTRDGRLLLWNDIHRGARQLASGLKTDGAIQWCDSKWSEQDVDGRSRLRVVVGRRSKRGFQAVICGDINGEERVIKEIVLQLEGDQPREIVGAGGALLVLHSDRIEAVYPETGELLGSRPNVELPFRQGRFFHRFEPVSTLGDGGRQWRALTYQPGSGELSIQDELVYCERADQPARILAAADTFGFEGPSGLTVEGDVIDLATGEKRCQTGRRLPRGIRLPLSLLGVSRDGQRFLVRGFCDEPGRTTRVVQLLLDVANGGSVTEVATSDLAALERPVFDLARPRVIHSKFRAIGVNSAGALTLVSRRKQHWPIVLNSSTKVGDLRFPAQPLAPSGEQPLRHLQEFGELASFAEGYSLNRAQWPDVSAAWLDGRGLLHLRSSDRSIPEVTLVLCDGPMAGWLSDGRTFGASYWLEGTSASLPAAEVNERVLKPFILCLT